MKKTIKIPTEWLALLISRMEAVRNILPDPHSESPILVSRVWNLIGLIETAYEIMK